MQASAVCEIFGPTMQGEGPLAGAKTMFVRFMGCDYHCSWCDTKYTWKKGELAPFEMLTAEQIVFQVLDKAPLDRKGLWVTLSGGNPALHDLAQVITWLKTYNFQVAVETQGSIAASWFKQASLVVLSPKGPSSGHTTNWSALTECIAVSGSLAVLKIVVFSDEDYDYAREAVTRYPQVAAFLQVGTIAELKIDKASSTNQILASYGELVERVLQDSSMNRVRVLPQLHTLLWGQRRGV